MKRLGYISLLIIIVLLPCLFMINSCKHDGIPAEQFRKICFNTEVLPIFGNCTVGNCHNGTGGESGYSYGDYGSIMASVTAGNSSKSKAYQAMISTIQLMPPGNALSVSSRTIIRLWIDQGADSASCKTSSATVPPITKCGKLLPSVKRTGLKVMPPSYALTKCEVREFELWVTQGYN